MKNFIYLLFTFGLFLFVCSFGAKSTEIVEKSENAIESEKLNDTEEIKKLIIQVLTWADTVKSIDLLPVLTDTEGSFYIGFDMNKHKENLETLSETGYFSIEFIENYNQIILTLDRKLRNHEYEYEWLVGDLPPFIFVSWWNGQERFPLQSSIIEVIDLNKTFGEFYFKCGNLEKCIGLENYKMKVKVSKEENK